MRRSLGSAARLLSPTRSPPPLASASHLAVLSSVASSSRLTLTRRPIVTAARRGFFSRELALAPQTRSYSSHAQPGADAVVPIPDDIPASDTFDVVIIGGGPAGLALASALMSHRSMRDTARVLLLEGGSLQPVREWDDAGEWSNRVSSLTAENISWLKSIGAWEHIAEHRSCPVSEIIVWANPDSHSTPTLHFPPLDRPLARMTENINLQRALLRSLDTAPAGAVTVRERARVSEIRLAESGGWVGLRIGDGDWVRASLVVGADGPNSPVRHFGQIDTFGHAYPTHAVVATLHHASSPLFPNDTAFQRFLPTGPIAFLPLADDASTMVWSTTPALAAALKRLSPEALVIAVNAGYTLPESDLEIMHDALLAADKAKTPLSPDGLAALLAALPPVAPTSAHLPPTVTAIPGSSVASFPLRLTQADSYTAHRLALVGDAAHTTHPLAGQGLNMGLADVRSLASTLDRARTVGSDLGSITALAPYPRERYLANHILLAAVDKLNLVFGARNGAINWARSTGLEVLNELGPVKKLFMASAGASDSARTPRSRKDREFGRARPQDDLPGRPAGFPVAAADALEAWLAVKGVLGMARGVLGEGLKNGLRRAADTLEKK